MKILPWLLLFKLTFIYTLSQDIILKDLNNSFENSLTNILYGLEVSLTIILKGNAKSFTNLHRYAYGVCCCITISDNYWFRIRSGIKNIFYWFSERDLLFHIYQKVSKSLSNKRISYIMVYLCIYGGNYQLTIIYCFYQKRKYFY